MTRQILLLTALALMLAIGLLASCGSDDPASPAPPAPDKREFIYNDPGDGGGGGGSPSDPPAEPTFLEQVIAAYADVPTSTITVSVDQSGDTVSVPAPDWTDRAPFVVIIPANSQLTGKRDIVIEYPAGNFDPSDPPVIPGDVTLFTFHNLPDLDTIEFLLPPAPWYDKYLLGTHASFYNFAQSADGTLEIVGAIQTIESPAPMTTAKIDIDHATHSLPDNPARGLLDPDEPGDEPEDPDDP